MLGAWHILPKQDAPSVLASHAAESSSEMAQRFTESLQRCKRIFLFFHGNAGNRATFTRPDLYKIMSRMGTDSHVFAIDYRGFGDSEGPVPSEQGLQIDALAAFHWITGHGVDPSKIIIVGHSLGSGVATHLAQNLSTLNIPCAGLVLLSAYNSIPDAALFYPYVPLIYPLSFLGSWVSERVKLVVNERWESFKNIQAVKSPILIIHGARDFEIRPWQGRSLFLSAVRARNTSVASGASSALQISPKSDAHFRSEVSQTHDGFGITPLQDQEAWLARSNFASPAESPSVNQLRMDTWYLEVKYGGHNSLNRFVVVEDTLAAWLESHLI